MDVSIIIPGIRQPRWLKLFNSIKNAVKNFKWELILAGPWEPLEDELKESTKVQWVQTWACPSVATQLATTLARGNLLFFSVDSKSGALSINSRTLFLSAFFLGT